MYERDIYGNTTDPYTGTKRDASGTIVGPGAPSAWDQSRSLVDPFDTVSTAQDKVFRANQAERGWPTDSTANGADSGGLGFWQVVCVVLGLAAIVGLMVAWAYWRMG